MLEHMRLICLVIHPTIAIAYEGLLIFLETKQTWEVNVIVNNLS